MDPDELVRQRGDKAVLDLLAGAKGLLEALIESALDESFTQADAHEKQARIQFVAKLLAEEDEPMVQAMAKGFTDMIAGRLDVVRSGPGAFRALELSVKQALGKAEAERRAKAMAAAAEGTPPSSERSGAVPRSMASSSLGTKSRIAPRTPGAPERRAISGILIEWPVLLDDPEVSEELTLLEGPSVTIVAALRRAFDPSEKKLDTDAFLEGLPSPLRAFASEHLANPTTENTLQAKGYLLDNANKLKRLLLSQEAAQIARETYRAQGDWDAESALAREASERLRAKHGLKP